MKPAPQPTKGIVVCAITHLVADVGEVGSSIVAEEHLVVVAEIGDKEVDQAIVLVVARSDAHRGNLAPILRSAQILKM